MNRKNKIIIGIVGITIVLLALLGLTYAYYLTRIQVNTNTTSISITTADLKLVYDNGVTKYIYDLVGIEPGIHSLKIMNDGEVKKESWISLSKETNVSVGEKEVTLSITEDDYNNSYYFRGTVSDNYVNFAGMCWRIVRIEGDGSVIISGDGTQEQPYIIG